MVVILLQRLSSKRHGAPCRREIAAFLQLVAGVSDYIRGLNRIIAKLACLLANSQCSNVRTLKTSYRLFRPTGLANASDLAASRYIALLRSDGQKTFRKAWPLEIINRRINLFTSLWRDTVSAAYSPEKNIFFSSAKASIFYGAHSSFKPKDWENNIHQTGS